VTFLVLFSIAEKTQPRWMVLFTKLLCVSRSSAYTHYTIEAITHGRKTDVLFMTENRGGLFSLAQLMRVGATTVILNSNSHAHTVWRIISRTQSLITQYR